MDTGYILGDIPSTVHKSAHYFLERYCFLDCRGPLEIPASFECGYGVKFLTGSHDISEGRMGPMCTRRTVIKDNVWVASFSLLFNCYLGAGVVVSAGSVVTGVEIPPHCMVQGNPGVIVATYIEDIKKWHRVDPIKPRSWTSK